MVLQLHMIILFLLGGFLVSPQSVAKPIKPGQNSAVSANILWPVYPGKKYRLFYRIPTLSWGVIALETHIGFGVSLPEYRETEGTFSERSLLLGLRGFVGKQWFSEAKVAIGRSLLEDHVTSKRNYESTDIELKAVVGYEFFLSRSVSLDIQAGAAKIASKSNPWPIYKDKNLTETIDEELTPLGAINVSYWFQ